MHCSPISCGAHSVVIMSSPLLFCYGSVGCVVSILEPGLTPLSANALDSTVIFFGVRGSKVIPSNAQELFLALRSGGAQGTLCDTRNWARLLLSPGLSRPKKIHTRRMTQGGRRHRGRKLCKWEPRV